MRSLLTRFLPLAVVASVLLPNLAQAETAPAERVVYAHELRPTQTEYGLHAVENKIKTWTTDAKANGQSLVQYAKDAKAGLPNLFAIKKTPVIIDPSGNIRALDGHHKLSALIKVASSTGVKVPVTVQIIHDYTGQSQKAYAEHFVNVLGKGYFGPNPPKSALAKVNSLPAKFSGMRNNTMRSVLGIVMDQALIEGAWFKDYVQFNLAHVMKTSGLLPKPPKDAATNQAYLNQIRDLVFSTPKFSRYLQGQLKPGAPALAKTTLSEVIANTSKKVAVKSKPVRTRLPSKAGNKTDLRTRRDRVRRVQKSRATGKPKKNGTKVRKGKTRARG